MDLSSAPSQPRFGKASNSVRFGQIPEGLVPTFLALASVTFLPATIFYLVAVQSQAVGTLVAGVLLVGGLAMGRSDVLPRLPMRPFITTVMVAGLGLLCHLVFAAFQVPIVWSRAGLSFGLLVAVAGFAIALSGVIAANRDNIRTAAAAIRFLFVVFGVLALLRVQPPGGSIALSQEKSMFPFAEPSHFAIAFTPYLIHACVTSGPIRRYLWLAFAAGLALGIQNLSLVVATALAGAVCLPLWQGGLLLAAAVSFAELLQLDYYTDRIDFSERTASVSNLVYRQGWEFLGDALARTHGWGIGWQQLGYAPFDSFSADQLYRLLGNDSNLYDGGFTGAKLGAELGVFGLTAVALYLYVFVRCMLGLRRVAKDPTQYRDPRYVFAIAAVAGLFVEAFVRGLGYFSGSFVLVGACAIYLYRTRSDRAADQATVLR